MTFVNRWLPAITEAPIRRTALGIAGLAVVGGAFAAPAVSVTGPDASSTSTAAAVSVDVRAVERGQSSRVLDYQYKAQENFYYCAPAATRIALSVQGPPPSQDEVAQRLGTTEAGTNSAEDTTRVLNAAGGGVYRTVSVPGETASPAEMDRLQVDVVRAIGAERAVVVNIKGTATDVDGIPHSYEGGHYLTVVGYDDHGRKVKIADPANPDQSVYWMSTVNLANWAAERGYSA